MKEKDIEDDMELMWIIEAQVDAIQQHSLVLLKAIRAYLEKRGVYRYYQNKRYKKKHKHQKSKVLGEFYADPEKAEKRLQTEI